VKLLIDTQLLLWAAGQPDRLSASARSQLTSRSNDLYFSAASIWEVSIKNSLGRDDFRADPRVLRRGLIDNGYLELPITAQHAAQVDTLPSHHKDPFDRMLIAQAISEGFTLLTTDSQLTRYKGPVRKV
jgi:PIN domain nuclease of toxin-antitoxin system